LRNSDSKHHLEDFRTNTLWSRWKNFDNYDIFNVYGHTIFTEPLLNDYSCGLDLGCFYQNRKKLPNPRLCALEFPSMKIYTQESLEDEQV
jgi:serine/threonine protein phosphatase 1